MSKSYQKKAAGRSRPAAAEVPVPTEATIALAEVRREGIALAKQRGAYRGRTRSLTAAQVGELTLRGR